MAATPAANIKHPLPPSQRTDGTDGIDYSLFTATVAAIADPIYSANDLVEAFKSSGAFDAIRNDLLKSYLASDGMSKFERDIEINIGEVISRLYQKKNDEVNGHHRRNSSLDGPGNTSRESIRSGTAASPSAANRLKSLQSVHGDKREDLDYVITQLDRQPAYDRASEDIIKVVNRQHGKVIQTQLEALLQKRGRGRREEEPIASYGPATRTHKKEEGVSIRAERHPVPHNPNVPLIPHPSLPVRPDFKAVYRDEPSAYRAPDVTGKSIDDSAWK